jgi:steroid 5-alpha reductase family enzyme
VSPSELDISTLGWIGLALGLLWLLSMLMRDASIIDIFWGVGFILIAIASGHHEAPGGRQGVVLVSITAWGVRLALHLYIRNRGKGEDPRYRAMRRSWGASFPLVSLLNVFVLQGVIMWIVSLPLQAAMRATEPVQLGALDYLGIVLVVTGLLTEAVADLQLAWFKDTPAYEGQTLDRGLWRYSRHPNYFGDCVLWWGFGLIALSVGAYWALVGPLLMTFMLLRVSGVPLLERRMHRTRYGYGVYAARTSTFVPMPPKG